MLKLSKILKELELKKGDKKSMENLEKTIDFLKDKDKILLLTTSNRWKKSGDTPKSTLLAKAIKKSLGKKVELIEVPELKIYPCEGNVSNKDGNGCGLKDAILKNKTKYNNFCLFFFLNF